MSEPVLFSVEDGIATITLNRPEAGNAIDLPMAYALVQAAIACDNDASIRCVVLTGAGRMFCVGGDVGLFAAAGDKADTFINELAGVLHMAVSRLARMPKPLLTLVNGPAAGAGLGLAIAGDVVLAARSAHFTAAYGAIGLSPDGGLTWLLPRLVGLRKAQDIILSNRRVKADDAQAMGLITRAVDDDALASEGADTAATLSRAATAAVGAARALLMDSYQTGLENHLEAEVRSITAMGRGPESKEGIAAFFAKRKPDFKIC